MPKEIFNEGRVVGLSSYQTYVKQALSTSPNIPVATEREWLSSTIANGTSMLLKVSPTTNSYEDYELPTTSRLVATNTIIASFMYGVEATFNGNWATQITNYGKIANAPSSASTVTSLTNTTYTDAQIKAIQKKQMQYIKIADGVVYQKGKWKSSGVSSPKTIPDKTSMVEGNAKVRLLFSDSINDEFYVLLTGFVDLQVAQGTTGLDSSVNTNAPQNGDFLGPATFPWMSKIWIATPGNLSYALKNGLSNGGKKNVVITSGPDSVITTIEVLNNIHTDKSGNFLKITQTLDGGDTNIDIDGSALIDDILAPGIGTNLVDASNNPKNSFGTARKVIKTNINAPEYSGITINPLSTRDDKQGAVTQNISTNLVSDNGSGIDFENGTANTTEKKIKAVLESGNGSGITIGSGTGKAKKIVTNIVAGKGIQITDDSNSTKRTIHSNLTPGDGIVITPVSSTSSGAQTIKHRFTRGSGIYIEALDNATDPTTQGKQMQVRSNVKGGIGIKINPKSDVSNTGQQTYSLNYLAGVGITLNTVSGSASTDEDNFSTGGQLRVRTNLTAGSGIIIDPTSSDSNTGIQTIRTNLVAGDGIKINPSSSNTAGAQTVSLVLEDGNGTKVVDGSAASGTSGKAKKINLNLRAGTGIGITNNNGIITITNTLPNFGSLDNMYRLELVDTSTSKTAYKFENGFYGGRHMFGSGNSRSEWKQNTYGTGSGDGTDGSVLKDRDGMLVGCMKFDVSPSWNDNGKINRVDFRITTGEPRRAYDSSGIEIWSKPMNITPFKLFWVGSEGGIPGDDDVDSVFNSRRSTYDNINQYLDSLRRSVICGFKFSSMRLSDSIPVPYEGFEEFTPQILSKFNSISTTTASGAYQFKAYPHTPTGLSFSSSIYPQINIAAYLLKTRTRLRNGLQYNASSDLIISVFSSVAVNEGQSFGFPGSYTQDWNKTRYNLTASSYSPYTNIVDSRDISRYVFDIEGTIMQMDFTLIGAFINRSDWT